MDSPFLSHRWSILAPPVQSNRGTLLWYSTSVLYSGTLLSAAGENFGVLCSGTLIRYLEIVRYSSLVLYSGTLLGYSTPGIRYSTVVGYSTPGMSAAGENFLLLCSGSLVWYFEMVLYLRAPQAKKKKGTFQPAAGENF